MVEKELGRQRRVGWVTWVHAVTGSRPTPISTSRRRRRVPFSRVARSPPSYPNVSNIAVFLNQGESHYDAMQFVFQRRYSAGRVLQYALHAGTCDDPRADGVGLARSSNGLTPRMTFAIGGWARPTTNFRGGVTHGRRVLGFLAGWQVNCRRSGKPVCPSRSPTRAARMNTGGADRPNMVGDPELPSDQRTLRTLVQHVAFRSATAICGRQHSGHGAARAIESPAWYASVFKNLAAARCTTRSSCARRSTT